MRIGFYCDGVSHGTLWQMSTSVDAREVAPASGAEGGAVLTWYETNVLAAMRQRRRITSRRRSEVEEVVVCEETTNRDEAYRLGADGTGVRMWYDECF